MCQRSIPKGDTMNERFRGGYDNVAQKALEDAGLRYTHSSCPKKGCVSVISSPEKLGEKLEEIREKFPKASIIEIPTVSCGYLYSIIQLWEEE